jgi:hypothetical protein
MSRVQELKSYIKNLNAKVSSIENNATYKINAEKVKNGIRIPYNDWKTYNSNQNSLFYTYMRLSQVEKELLDNKDYQKEQKKIAKEARAILRAGDKFKKQKNKNKVEDIIRFDEGERERKKYEHGFGQIEETENKLLNNTFNISSYTNKDVLNIYVNRVISPNETFIINTIERKLLNRREDIGRKFQINSYITMKFIIKSYNSQLNMTIRNTYYYNSNPIVITSSNIIRQYALEVMDGFYRTLENIQQGNSGGTFDGIIKLSIKTALAKSALGKSYIELPKCIKDKKACCNIKNDDNKCFKWCLVAYKNWDKVNNNHKNEVKQWEKLEDTIKEPENYNYPVLLQDIELFEELNDYQINILELNEHFEAKPLRTTMNKRKEIVNLLLIHDEDNSHYVLVRDLSRLCSSPTTKHKKYICQLCVSVSYEKEENLMNHQLICSKNEPCLCELPAEGKNIMKFKNFNNEFMHPFHIVADFESTLQTVNNVKGNTQQYQKHIQNSFGLKYNCIYPEYSEPVYICNNSNPNNLNEQFIVELERLAKKSYDLTQQNKTNIIMTEEEKKLHKDNKNCNKCKLTYTKENNKVRHHDHITGKFIDTICYNCNIQLQYKKFIPVYIHNLKGYDAHLFISSLNKYGYKADKRDIISCIPNNEERYISFSKEVQVGTYKDDKKITRPIMFEIRFIDTFAFMASSIESLAQNLRNSCQTISDKRKVFKNVSDHFKDDEQFELMTQKGIYPYDWVNDYEKLNSDKLPSRKDFYSKLTNSKCNKKEYQQALKVWETFKCKKFLDYHNIYLISDVLLLTDIWENFREVCFKNYNLDCEYYYTAPSLSFDSMLKMTKIELELLTDLDKYLFVENGIRGGISQISKRHAVANNKYMSNYHLDNNSLYGNKNDEIIRKIEEYIIYLDANNLYGHAMCQYLPVSNFKWNEEEWDTNKILSLNNEGEKGYLFSVDLDIPEDKHDYFNAYPLCPENRSIKKSELNQWQQEDYKESKIKKLCLTLYNKKDYIVNYRYLKLALSLGYKLKKVNKVLEYTQSNFLKEYIMKNTELRTLAKNDFEKDFYKLMNNSVYGKTMENVRNRINFRLISNEAQALRVKNMKRFVPFDETLVGVHIQKTKVLLNKPIYLGQNILDDSKVLMSDFHYNFMYKHIDIKNIDLLFTDTDSLCYHIRNFDVFELMKKEKSFFDLSNYDKNHELYDKTNNKVIGKFKNESPEQIKEFVGLRSKLYSFIVDGEKKSHNKCKGVKKCVAEKLKLKHYKNTNYKRVDKEIKQNGIRSYKHQLFTETINKVALSCFDDKRYICDDNIHTYSFGHKDITK